MMSPRLVVVGSSPEGVRTRGTAGSGRMNRWFNHWMEPATGRGVGLVGELVREGDYWTVAFGGREFRARHSKGIRYLAELLSRPGVPLSALELAAVGSAPGAPSERHPGDAGADGV